MNNTGAARFSITGVGELDDADPPADRSAVLSARTQYSGDRFRLPVPALTGGSWPACQHEIRPDSRETACGPGRAGPWL